MEQLMTRFAYTTLVIPVQVDVAESEKINAC